MDPNLATDKTTAEFERRADATVTRISANPDNHLGLSGAQVGAAKFLAFRGMRDGWRNTLDVFKRDDKDRLTMVSCAWPHIESPQSATV